MLKECFINILVVTGLVDIGLILDPTVVLNVLVMYFEKHRVLPKLHMQLRHIQSIVIFCQGIV